MALSAQLRFKVGRSPGAAWRPRPPGKVSTWGGSLHVCRVSMCLVVDNRACTVWAHTCVLCVCPRVGHVCMLVCVHVRAGHTRVHAYVCSCACTCACFSVCLRACVCVWGTRVCSCACEHTRVLTRACLHACVCPRVWPTRMYVCTRGHTRVCAFVCSRACVHMLVCARVCVCVRAPTWGTHLCVHARALCTCVCTLRACVCMFAQVLRGGRSLSVLAAGQAGDLWPPSLPRGARAASLQAGDAAR